MLDLRSRQILGTVILVAVAAVTLVVAPTLLDPINLPKLCTLAFFSIVALSLYLSSFKELLTARYRTVSIVSIGFILQIFLVLIFSGGTLNGQIYGTHGRNTGALA